MKICNPRHDKNGFTLIELLTIIIIIGVLATTVYVRYTQFSDASKAATCRSNQSSLELAALMYLPDHQEYPDSIELLAPYFRSGTLPECPTGGAYTLDANGRVYCIDHPP